MSKTQNSFYHKTAQNGLTPLSFSPGHKNKMVQGIIWCVLSLLAIFCYSCVLKPGPQKYGNKTRITYVHYLAAYFQGNCDEELDFYKKIEEVTSSDKVLVLSILVYIFNFTMAIASIIVMFALRSKRRHIMFGWLIFYLIITFCVAVIDLVSTGVVASDYFAVSRTTLWRNSGLAALSLMVLALITSRGVFLWAANLLFSVYLISFICRIQKDQASPVAVTHTNDASYEERAASTPTKSEETFKIDSRAMESRPVVVLNQGAEKNNSSEYPPYSAYSRWPRLHPENRLSKPTTLPKPSQIPQREQQENFQQPRPKARPPAPPVNYAPTPTAAPTEYDVNPGPGVRPDSLQEALLTIRALKQVRPRITAIPDSYP
ncbi:uncharacterized protein isoform X3 [Rhodnius prolixus]|uniref:uncharacterized protein isoform X3 n=1 Tax=Rhodnius prolixus TaxID=13249 RepID=UPI003D18ACAB